MSSLIESANSVAASWLHWALNVSWQVALLGLLVWLLSLTLPRSPASFRCMLWLLVLAKLVVPPSLTTPWSLGPLLPDQYGPWRINVERISPVADGSEAVRLSSESVSTESGSGNGAPGAFVARFDATAIIMVVWGAAALALLAGLQARYRHYARLTLGTAGTPSTEMQLLLDECKAALAIRHPVQLLVSPAAAIPAALGVWKPAILIPCDLAERFSRSEMVQMLLHELAHVKRNDVVVSWLAALATCLFWFHPVVWLVNLQLRREREMATDDLVLRHAQGDAKTYAATILRAAEGYGDPVPAGVGMLGVLEVSDNLLHRVRSITDAQRPRRMGFAWTALLCMVVLLLPMGGWGQAAAPQQTPVKPAEAPGGVPMLVKTDPAIGAKDVDPALKELKLTFDKDMAGGFSWTGGGEYHPKGTDRPRWLDKRTCVMPVALEPGKYYIVGINSKSHQNFRSEAGQPTPPRVLYFVTKGADEATLAMVKAPTVVKLSPENGAKNVPTSLTDVSVTFDIPMGGGCSFTGSQETVPKGMGPVKWSEDRKTCTMPVALEPSKEYRTALNSFSHNNFRSASGVPLEPVEWKFTTGK